MIRFHKRVAFNKNKGFSLIELIIAIAILVILTGFLAPQFMRYIEKSRESVCRKNMDEMLNIYRMEFVGDDKYTVEKVIEEYEDRDPCPSGGKYVDGTNRMGGIPWIFCEVHDAEILKKGPDEIVAEVVYSEMIKFAGKNNQEICALLNTAFGLPSAERDAITWVRNDHLREYLYKTVYKNSWPKSQIKINGEEMYIQPYINIKDGLGNTKETDVLMFANAGNKAAGNWNAKMIYYDGMWYKGPTDRSVIGIQNKSNDEIVKLLTDENWAPVKQ